MSTIVYLLFTKEIKNKSIWGSELWCLELELIVWMYIQMWWRSTSIYSQAQRYVNPDKGYHFVGWLRIFRPTKKLCTHYEALLIGCSNVFKYDPKVKPQHES